MNPLEGLVTNPLFAVGMQMLNNNRRVPASQYQGAFAGVPQALMGAAYNQRMMKQSALEDERMARMREDWKFQDSERQRREAANQALQGLIGQGQETARMGEGAMVGEPADLQAGGYPINPLNPQAIYGALAQGDQSQQALAIQGMLKPQEQNKPMVVGGNLVNPLTGQVIFSAPSDPNALTFEQRKELAALRGGGQGGSPYFTPMPVADANGNPSLVSFNNRTGTAAPVALPGGAALVKSSDSVPLQSALTGGKTGAQKEAERQSELKKDYPAAVGRLRDARQKVRDLTPTIQSAIEQTGRFGASGFGSNAMQAVGGGAATDLASTLQTIKANLGFAELQKMRDNSPTGGALGQVAVQELEALQSTIASLNQSQSDAQLRANLGKVAEHLQNWQRAVEASYNDRYGQQAAPSGDAPDILNQADAILNGSK